MRGFARLFLAAGFVFVLSLGTAATAMADGGAQIQTDRGDYAPGATVTFHGSGFTPGETVAIAALGSDNATSITTTSVADATGAIQGSFDLPIVAETSYALSGTGSTSGLVATTTFKDFIATKLTVAASSGTFGGNTIFSALLTAPPFGALPGQTIFFARQGIPVGSAVTNAAGVATLAPVSLDALPAGTYPSGVGAGYAGFGPFDPSTGSAPLTIAPQPTAVIVSPASGPYGGSTTFSATLLFDGGLPLAGRPVFFFRQGVLVGSATTAANGVATLTGVSLDGLSAATYPGGVYAEYAGEINFSPSNGVAALTIAPQTTFIIVAPASGTYGGSTAFSATLRFDGGLPLIDRTLAFQRNGVAVGTATTDTSGIATLSSVSLDAVNAGTYATGITASFAGELNFQATSGNGPLTVNPAPLTITADNKTKIYLAPLPTFTATFVGFVLGQGPGALSGTLAFTTSATATSPVGTYPITPSGLSSTNYAITYVNGTLTVTYDVCVLYDQTKVSKSGSTIPVKVEVCGAGGVNVSSASIIVHATSVTLASTSVTGQPEDSGNANPEADFRFSSPLYIYNLSTKGLASGTYLLHFTISGDPLEHTVQFMIR